MAEEKTILLIEDDKNTLNLYEHVLTKAGFKVETTETGANGQKLLEEKNYDILLLDLLLPDIHGFDLLRNFKSQKPDSKTIIVLLTNLNNDESLKQGFELGAQGYLVKSAHTPDEIVDQIKKLL